MTSRDPDVMQRLFRDLVGRTSTTGMTWTLDVVRGFILGMQMAQMQPEWVQAYLLEMQRDYTPEMRAMMRRASSEITGRIPISSDDIGR